MSETDTASAVPSARATVPGEKEWDIPLVPCISQYSQDATAAPQSLAVLSQKSPVPSLRCDRGESHEDYVNTIVDDTLASVDSRATLQEAVRQPGMGLLLSLSDKLPSPLPSFNPSLPAQMPVHSQNASVSPLPDDASQSASASATGLTTSTEMLSCEYTTFDHSSHLDSIASAATAAAATQYHEARAFHEKLTLASCTPPPSLLSKNNTGQPLETRPFSIFPSGLTQSPSKPTPDFAATSSTSARLSTSSESSVKPSSHVAIPSFTNHSSSGNQTPCTEAGSPLPEVIGHGPVRVMGSDPIFTDDAVQHKTIEEVVEKLQAHHHMAPSAVMQQHPQKMSLSIDVSPCLAMHGEPEYQVPRLATSLLPMNRCKSEALPLEQVPQVLRKPHAPVDTCKPAGQSTTTDNNTKRFQCPKCNRAFARAYNLNTHMSIHDPDPQRSKPFPCPYRSCQSEGGRSFSRKHDLQRHVASVHEWEPEPGINGDSSGAGNGKNTGGLASLGLGARGKKFRCDQCGRAFVRRDALRRHHCENAALASGGTRLPPAKHSIPYAVHALPNQVLPQVAFQLMTEPRGYRDGLKETSTPDTALPRRDPTERVEQTCVARREDTTAATAAS